MTIQDFEAIGLWLATIAVLIALAREPWRRTRREPIRRPRNNGQPRQASPLGIFLMPGLVFAAPLIQAAAGAMGGAHAPMAPHAYLPLWPLLLFALLVQFLARWQFLQSADRQRGR